jgi:cytoskeleton protein RodZ
MAMVEAIKPDFGTRMKRSREDRGVSLRQIADATKISVGSLEALERNDISRLPGGIFSRAFVRSYAIEIGVDPEQAVRDFIVQFPDDSVTAGSPHVPRDYEAEMASSGRPSGAMLIAMVAVTLVVGVILFFALSR